jgi:hypothetical protein
MSDKGPIIDPNHPLARAFGVESEQGKGPPSEPAPHSEFPIPRSWGEAWPIILWGMLAFSFVLVFADSMAAIIEKPLLRAGVAAVALLGVTAMLIYRDRLQAKFRDPSGSLIVGAICTVLLVLALSPFVEQPHWPFSAWFPIISKAEYDALGTKLTAANNEITSREQQRALAEQQIIIIQQEVGALQAKINAYEQKLGVSSPANKPPPSIPDKSKNQHKPEDVAILMDIWQSIETRDMNSLVEATNYLYGLQEQWPAKIKKDKKDFLREVSDARKMIIASSQKLADLRDEYPQYQDIRDTFEQPYLPPLLKALDRFSNEIAALPDSLPLNYETIVRSASGALKREMDAAVAWIQSARTTAGAKRKEFLQ